MIPDRLRALIDDADVVSFDVFDTLLSRHHYVPADVFSELGSGAIARSFRTVRIVAERLARWRHRRQEDVSLAQIYGFCPGTPEAELAAERRSLHANPKMRAAYEYAVSRHKTIVAVSDMYLPASAIAEFLRAAGFSSMAKVYVSHDVGSTKGSGSLYRHVAHDLGVEPSRIVHIGDNAASDYHQALRSGMNAFHYPAARELFEQRNPVHPDVVRALRGRRKPSHTLLLGLLRDGLADVDARAHYWYALGFSTVGPLANAFTQWIRDTAVAHGVRRLYFLARDGRLPHAICALRFPELEGVYTHASRRLFILPALAAQADSFVLRELTAGLPGLPAREYWSRLELEDARVEAMLEKWFPGDARILSLADYARLREFFIAIQPLLLEHATKERDLLAAYLSHIGLLGGGPPRMIVDVGWRASSQRHLETAFPELRGTPGVYLGLSSDAYRNGRMSAFFFEGTTPRRLHHMTTHCVELVELMFSSPEPSVRAIRRAGDGFAPREEAGIAASTGARAEIVREMHRGALDFTERLAALEKKGFDVRLDRHDAALFLAPVMLRPMPLDIEHIGAVPHDLGLGNSRYETLLPPQPPRNPFRLLWQFIGAKRVRLYWPRGLTRKVHFAHGAMCGFGARCAVTLYAIALHARGWAHRLLRS